MSRHDDMVRLRHMLGYAREAVVLAQRKTLDDLMNERLLQLALTHLVEIVGEAAAQISREERAKHPAIPWQDVVGMRNRLVHAYNTVDLGILWDTVTDDLPRLIEDLEKSIPSESEC